MNNYILIAIIAAIVCSLVAASKKDRKK